MQSQKGVTSFLDGDDGDFMGSFSNSCSELFFKQRNGFVGIQLGGAHGSSKSLTSPKYKSAEAGVCKVAFRYLIIDNGKVPVETSVEILINFFTTDAPSGQRIWSNYKNNTDCKLVTMGNNRDGYPGQPDNRRKPD